MQPTTQQYLSAARLPGALQFNRAENFCICFTQAAYSHRCVAAELPVMERYLRASTALMLAAAAMVGTVTSLLASTYIHVDRFQSALILLFIVCGAWLLIEKGAIRKFAGIPRSMIRPDRSFGIFVLKIALIVWIGLGAYANFDVHSIRSSIIFVVLLNVLTGAVFEAFRGLR